VDRVVLNAMLNTGGEAAMINIVFGQADPPLRAFIMKIEKAVVLAAGRGTRMREMTAELPKPMLELRGKPVLQHILEGLRDAGIAEFLVIVGYRAETVQNFFGDGSRYNVGIQYATQIVQNGTGRVVELARDFVGDSSFVLSYGDILVDPENYKRIVDLPDNIEAIITVKPGEDLSKGGAVFVNEQMELIDIREKSPSVVGIADAGSHDSRSRLQLFYNAGIYAFRPSIFEFIARLKPSPRGEYELTDAIRDLAHSGKKVKALEITGEWADVRDPEILARLNAQL
jgi:dTDP-glucose pyrophosphorylase